MNGPRRWGATMRGGTRVPGPHWSCGLIDVRALVDEVITGFPYSSEPWKSVSRRRKDVFKINGMDHIVLNVPDINSALSFYMDVLGLEPERLDQFLRGEVPFPSV